MISPPSTPVQKLNRYDALAVGLLCVAIALPVRGLMRYQGAAMEEGFMLAFPEMILKGMVPNKDFLHLYGPGSLWALAGTFKVTGVSLAAERIVALAQHCGIIFAVYALTRRFGRGVALVAASTTIAINMVPTGLIALAWNGGIAFGLWSIWCAIRARDVEDPRRANMWLAAAGVLASLALLYRPDLIVAVGLAAVAVLWKLKWKQLRWALAGLGVAFFGYVVHLIMAGPVNAIQGMIIDPVFRLRDGRSLPMPPKWDHLVGYFQKASALRTVGWPFPQLGLSQQLYIWFVLTLLSGVGVAVYGLWRLRRSPQSPLARTLAGVGLFGLGISAQAFQRVDQAHLAWVSCITLAMVPVAIAHELTRRGIQPLTRLAPTVAAAAFSTLLLTTVIPQYTVRGYVDLTSQTFGYNTFGFAVDRNGRNFYLPSPEISTSLQALIDDLDARKPQPGERLFVGPMDLRFTPYNDAFLYYLYPELTPSTFFVEMDPFVVEEGSGLADDVASADWLILSNVWKGWKEPNASSRPGADAPNEVVRTQFCRLGHWGEVDGEPLYELYRRCDQIPTTPEPK